MKETQSQVKKRLVFIGYSDESKGYKLYNPLTGKVTISRDIVFHEEKEWGWTDISGTSSNIEACGLKTIPLASTLEFEVGVTIEFEEYAQPQVAKYKTLEEL